MCLSGMSQRYPRICQALINGVNNYANPAYPHTHKEFERVFNFFILDKSEITSK